MNRAIRILTPLALIAIAQTAALAQFPGMGGGGGFDDAALAPVTPQWELFKLNAKTRVKINFHNASPDAVIQTLSQASGLTILKDPALTAGITIQSPNAVALKDAFAMFNLALGMRGFEIKKDGAYLVIKAKRASFPNMGGFNPLGGDTFPRPTSQGVLRTYALTFADATQVARVINEVFVPADQTATNAQGANPFAGGGFNPFQGRFGGAGGGGFQRPGRPNGNANVRASAETYSNSVIVSATATDHTQVEKIIKSIDKQTDQPQQTRLYTPQYASVSDLATVVNSVLFSNANRGRAGQTIQGQGGGGGFNPFRGFGGGGFGGGGGNNQNNQNIAVETRTNTIVVTAPEETQLIVEKTIKQLDRPTTYASSAFVLTLDNARADDVAQLLNQAFSGQRTNGNTTGRTGTGTANRTNTTTGNRAGGSTNAPATLGRNTGSISRGVAQAQAINDAAQQSLLDQQGTEIAQFGGFGGGFGGGGQFGGGGGQFGQNRNGAGGNVNRNQSGSGTMTGYDENGKLVNVRDVTGGVTVIPDINTNSIIIVASPEARKIVEGIVKQLDKIPEQVMIETLIVEATLDASTKLGVEWNFTSGNNVTTSAFGAAADTTQPQGLRYTLTGAGYGALVQAVQSDTRFQVLSTPRIFTSNNSSAEINISQSLPYISNQTQNANGTFTTSTSYLDVGIVLTVTPRITSNGYVTMDVTQTANDLQGYTSFGSPIVNQREAQTTVSVKDNETVVLGGIIKTTASTTQNKVPLLGDLPLVGNLFRSKNITTNKTELLVFLTPRVVRDEKEARRLREQNQGQLDPKTMERIFKSPEGAAFKKRMEEKAKEMKAKEQPLKPEDRPAEPTTPAPAPQELPS